MGKHSPNLELAFLAFLLLLVSAPAVLGMMRENSEAVQPDVMKAIVQELAREEVTNAYYKQEMMKARRNNNKLHYLKEVVEHNVKCSLLGFPCKQNTDCCIGTCRFIFGPLANLCTLV